MRAIDVRNLSWVADARPILRGVSFSIGVGEAWGLLGPNGSGKSTLLRVISGVIDDLSAYPADARMSVSVGDQTLAELSAPALAERVSYLGGELTSEFPIRVDQAIGISAQPGCSPAEALEYFGIAQLAARELRTLSSGERQMVALASAYARGSRIWLLDEALVRLDLHHRAAVLRRLRELREQGFSFVVVSHDLWWIENLCERAVWLNDGKVAGEGKARDMLSDRQIHEIYEFLGPS